MKNYLDGCQRIEQAMAAVYRKLAGVESYSDKLRIIFAQMARDEDDHARQLERAKSVPEEVFTRNKRFDQRKLDELLHQAQLLLRLAAEPDPSESLMLETAKDLEMEFIKIHLRNAVSLRDESVGEMFREMAREDQEHFETLDSYYEDAEPSE